MSQRKSSLPRPIVIIGAGIIGLTTAIRVLESPAVRKAGIPVHVIADHLPADPLDPNYASTIAGAHHLSFADDEDMRQRRWDSTTFRIMMDEWKREGEKSGLMKIKQTEYYVGETKHLKIYEEHPDFVVNALDGLPVDFKPDHSVTFTSLTMTPATYLLRLLTRIDKLGGRIHRVRLHSLGDLYAPQVRAMIGAAPSLVIVCTGLGARTLGGVEDGTVYPTRGQVIKIKAPWIREGFTRQVGSLNGAEGGERTYVIPRPDGEVIIGGTREANDWEPYPRPDTKEDIIRRASEICRTLGPEHAQLSPQAVGELVVEDLVGFRPSREGGVRLEQGPDLTGEGSRAAVFYNYGHGGAGWQSCWGCADDAAKLVEKELRQTTAKL